MNSVAKGSILTGMDLCKAIASEVMPLSGIEPQKEIIKKYTKAIAKYPDNMVEITLASASLIIEKSTTIASKERDILLALFNASALSLDAAAA